MTVMDGQHAPQIWPEKMGSTMSHLARLTTSLWEALNHAHFQFFPCFICQKFDLVIDPFPSPYCAPNTLFPIDRQLDEGPIALGAIVTLELPVFWTLSRHFSGLR